MTKQQRYAAQGAVGIGAMCFALYSFATDYTPNPAVTAAVAVMAVLDIAWVFWTFLGSSSSE